MANAFNDNVSRLEDTSLHIVTPKKPICTDMAAPSTHIYVCKIAKSTSAVSLKAGACLDMTEDGKFSSAVATDPSGILMRDVDVGTDADATASVLVSGTVDASELSNIAAYDTAMWGKLIAHHIYPTEAPNA